MMTSSGDSYILLVTLKGGKSDLAIELDKVAKEIGEDVHFDSVAETEEEGLRDQKQGEGNVERSQLPEWVAAAVQIAPIAASAASVLRTIFQYASRNGNGWIELTGANGARAKFPTSVPPDEFGKYVEEFRKLGPVEANIVSSPS